MDQRRNRGRLVGKYKGMPQSFHGLANLRLRRRMNAAEALTRIKAHLRATGEREVPSRDLGELVMEELRQLDEVAFVRFA